MNFDFTDDQQAIKRTAKELLAARFKPERVRELAEAGEYDDGAWKEMCELGWPGIFIDEEHGGQGLGIVELVILMEELGYALAPVPFLSNAAAGLALQFAGTDEQQERWLPGHRLGRGARHRRACCATARRGSCPTPTRAEVIVLIAPGGERWWSRRRRPRSSRSRRWTARAASRACAPTAASRSAGDRSPRPTGSSPRCPPSRSEWRRRRWRWPWSTRATASSSAARSAPTRPSRTAARRCCSRWRARARARYYAGLVRRRRAGVAAAGRLDGEGVLLRRRLARVRLVAPGARRDRLHLGARPALLPQAGEDERASCTARPASTASAWPDLALEQPEPASSPENADGPSRRRARSVGEGTCDVLVAGAHRDERRAAGASLGAVVGGRLVARPGVGRLPVGLRAAGALVGAAVEARARSRRGRLRAAGALVGAAVEAGAGRERLLLRGSTAGRLVATLSSSSFATITSAAASAQMATSATASSARTALKWQRRTTAGCCLGMACPMTASCVGSVLDIGGHGAGRRFQRGDRAVTAR